LAVWEEEIIFQSLNFDDDLNEMKNQKQFSKVFLKHEAEVFQMSQNRSEWLIIPSFAESRKCF
jgi:hypothetical protein